MNSSAPCNTTIATRLLAWSRRASGHSRLHDASVHTHTHKTAVTLHMQVVGISNAEEPHGYRRIATLSVSNHVGCTMSSGEPGPRADETLCCTALRLTDFGVEAARAPAVSYTPPTTRWPRRLAWARKVGKRETCGRARVRGQRRACVMAFQQSMQQHWQQSAQYTNRDVRQARCGSRKLHNMQVACASKSCVWLRPTFERSGPLVHQMRQSSEIRTW